MDRKLVFVLVLSLACGVWGYGEEDATGRPAWQDRANQVLVNAVRLCPSCYKSIYMSGWDTNTPFSTSTYPAVPPLYFAWQLDDSSFSHSLDMATTNTFSHSSSDGTDPFTRIGLFYNCSGWQGENIAAGYASPLDTNNQWLCDGSQSACAPDGNGDGHRSNIMSKNYKAIGVGFSYKAGSSYSNYWTQDFGGAVCLPTVVNAIYGGSHIFVSGNTKFIATFYTSSTSAPTTAQVNVDGTAYNLAFELGMSAGQGNFVFSQASGTACRNYYFVFVSGGVTYRYPDTGFLVTYKEGSCVTSFTTGVVSTAAPSTSAPTTAAPSTSAPTTAAPSTSAPTTADPSTSAPSTDAPTTVAPTTSLPTTAVPTITVLPTTTAPTTTVPTTTRQPWTTTTVRATTTTARPASTTPRPTTTTARPASTTPRPTTTSSPGTTTTSSGSSFSKDIITNHNVARTAALESGLSWNDTIATFATNYAKLCTYGHNSNNKQYGENIYAASGAVPTDAGVRASTSWISEKANFNCAANSCASGKTCGHYTQVIWQATTQVGCAAVTCTTGSPFGSSFPTWNFIVCDYWPPGNYVGQRPCPTGQCPT